MKKIVTVLAFSVVAALIIIISLPPKEVQTEISKQNNDHDLIINYGEYKGNPLELVYDSVSKDLRVRVLTSYDMNAEDSALTFLKMEVIKMTTGIKTFQLGESGYTFHFSGGYPTWGPYGSLGPDYFYKCLLFSRNTTIKGKDIYVWGSKQKDYYYPYPDSVGTKLN